jgi:hypothetical protein
MPNPSNKSKADNAIIGYSTIAATSETEEEHLFKKNDVCNEQFIRKSRVEIFLPACVCMK